MRPAVTASILLWAMGFAPLSVRADVQYVACTSSTPTESVFSVANSMSTLSANEAFSQICSSNSTYMWFASANANQCQTGNVLIACAGPGIPLPDSSLSAKSCQISKCGAGNDPCGDCTNSKTQLWAIYLANGSAFSVTVSPPSSTASLQSSVSLTTSINNISPTLSTGSPVSAAPSSTGSPSAGAGTSPSASGASGIGSFFANLNVPLIAGVGGGIAVLLAIAITCCIVSWRRKKAATAAESASNPPHRYNSVSSSHDQFFKPLQSQSPFQPVGRGGTPLGAQSLNRGATLPNTQYPSPKHSELSYNPPVNGHYPSYGAPESETHFRQNNLPASLYTSSSPPRPSNAKSGMGGGYGHESMYTVAATMKTDSIIQGYRTSSIMEAGSQRGSFVPSKDTSRLVKVTKEFDPVNSDEIEMRAGDMIEIHQTFDDGWAYGYNHRSKLWGVFPQDCV
ncbi:uncharacterized protein BJ171DRAFT_500799 [Polychytrium aggregatum]|uniref:uncharacterized protein n=1 Tax=Polychytrium aggregatum TaxID=110093 RepID=UPI0022FE98F5|nr:uncharacterized protein BJ171DRAFT_500799 [Polychytrium aggregatum]KAI9205570.1 hypothetical protein BJ171DRAFT_500799 [Polychytrium aggregatum]